MIYRSDDISLISTALSKAQGSYKPLVSNQPTAAGRFANLEAILSSCRESLSKNELAFSQYLELQDEGAGASILKTVIMHSSGQWISTAARIVSLPTFRETFNCIEAYRRLHALLILGIAPSVDDPMIQDDHGLAEQDKAILKDLRKPVEAKPKSKFIDTISKEQYDDLMYELEGYTEIVKGILSTYEITSIADLPKEEYYKVQTRIRKLKKIHEEGTQR